MSPDEAAAWCLDHALQLRWSLFRRQHLVYISGLEVRSVVREYSPNDPEGLEKILDEMVAEMRHHLAGPSGGIHASFSHS